MPMRNYDKYSLSHLVRTNIRKYRKLRNYTLQELADRAEFTHQYVRYLECLSVDKTPTLEALGKFAEALDIDIRQLFDDIEDDH